MAFQRKYSRLEFKPTHTDTCHKRIHRVCKQTIYNVINDWLAYGYVRKRGNNVIVNHRSGHLHQEHWEVLEKIVIEKPWLFYGFWRFFAYWRPHFYVFWFKNLEKSKQSDKFWYFLIKMQWPWLKVSEKRLPRSFRSRLRAPQSSTVGWGTIWTFSGRPGLTLGEG